MKYLKQFEELKPMEYANVKFEIGDIVEFNDQNKYISDHHDKGDVFIITNIEYYYKAYDKRGHPIRAMMQNVQPITISFIKNNKIDIFAQVKPDQINIASGEKANELKIKLDTLKYNL
jgi:hypothetical protein